MKYLLVRSIALVLLVCAGTAARASDDRVALVIGNAAYKTAPLANPRNDAHAMAELLRKAGFEVDERLDTSQQQLEDAIGRFGARIRDAKVHFGLFYYAGHGLQLQWRNYLVPVSAEIRAAEDVPRQTVDVSELFKYMNEAKGRSFLIILDACRDDPFGGAYKPPYKGLSQFDAPTGSLLAYATAPGNVALDGEGKNGLYTSNLLAELQVRGEKVEDVFKRVRLNVRLQSHGRQVPWETTSLEEDVYLFPTQRHKLSEGEQVAMLDEEMAAWSRVKSSSNIDALAAFLREHPSGYASELAQFRLNRMLAAQAAYLAKQEDDRRRAEHEQLIARQRAEEAQRLAQAQEAREAAEREASRVAEAARAARELAKREEAQRQQQALQEQETKRQEQATSERELEAQRRVEAARREEERVQADIAAQAKSRLDAELRTQANANTPPAPVATSIALNEPLVLEPTPYSSGYAEHLRRYKVGDVYTFRIVDRFNGSTRPLRMEVTSVDAERDRVEFNRGEFVSDLMGNITTNTRGSMSTPRQFYPAELFIGKKWQTMFRQERPNGVSYTFKYDVRVTGREKVTVPAGTFDAYRIEAHGFNMQLNASITRTIWVAPGVPADIAHETTVRLRNNEYEQYDRQELVSVESAAAK